MPEPNTQHSGGDNGGGPDPWVVSTPDYGNHYSAAYAD